MIPQRIHLAILCATIVVLIAFLVSLLAPTQAGAASRPRPCVGAVVRGDIAGVEIVRRSDRTICQRPAGGSPSRQAVHR